MIFRIVRSAIFLFLLFFGNFLHAQNLSGQWTGGFVTTGDIWGGNTEYVLELEINGNTVKGHSYTYFIISGKRHYVICRLNGIYDKRSKSLTVSEVEKVKSNTPPDFRDMFQTHMLTYLKQGEKETLQGKWKPYSTKDGGQGGQTTLERKALVRVKPTTPSTSLAKQQTKPVQQPVSKSSPSKTTKPLANAANPTTKKPIAAAPSTSPATGVPEQKKEKNALEKNAQISENRIEKPATVTDDKDPAPTPNKNAADKKLELRSNKLIQLIEVPASSFKVELYDNGQVDGDTVSLFFNGRLMVSKKRLSTSPIVLDIQLEPGRDDNELVMFAENLGSIPPNTALMVLTVGDKRYEVNITSTEQSNGTVRFRLKE